MLRYLFLFLLLVISLPSCKKEHLYKIPGSYHSLQQMSHSRAYPFEDIPADAFYKSYENHLKLKGDNSAAKSITDPWEPQGPLNTTGRTLTIAVNPQDDNTIYAGSASGGLWRSRELGAGVSWERVNTGFPVLGVSSIEFAPGDSTVMFIGTGEVYNYSTTGNDGAFRATRGSYGIGILKSDDGGKSWQKSLDWSYQNNHGVWMIEVSQSNPNIVYAATTEGVFKSEDQGDNWEMVLDVIMATDISVHSDNSDEVIAVCGNFSTPEKGIYKTTNGGRKWTQITENVPTSYRGKILIDRSVSNPNILFASIGNGFQGPDGATWLLRSDDGGDNWIEVNNLDYSKWQGWFAHDVAINPKNENEIITVGIDIYKSEDGGLTLNQQSSGGVTLGTPEIGVPDGPATYSHSDHHFVKYHPNLDSVVLFGNDGGVFISYDGGETFGSYNGGMQTTQFYNGFSVSQSSPDFAMGGLQDNSTSIFTGDGRWGRAIGGDGSWSAINQNTPQIVFGSWQYLNIRRSSNSGNSFSSISFNYGSIEDPLFIAPFVSSRSNPDVMYAGGIYVYRSDNTGLTWDPVNLGRPINGNPVYSMEVSMVDEDVIYIGTSPLLDAQTNIFPEVLVSIDGGVSWGTSSFDLPNRIPNDITTHPTDPATAYVCFSGFGTNHLFVTEDFGGNWAAIDNGIPDVPGNAIIVDPFDPSHLYYGNDLGVYFSQDAGNSWEVWTDGLPNAVIVMDLKISEFDQSIWVATHGNGTYKRELEPVTVSTEDLTGPAFDVQIFPNPSSDIINLKLSELAFNTYKLYIYDINGKLVEYQSFSGSEYAISISHLQSGKYNLSVQNDKNIFNQQIVKL